MIPAIGTVWKARDGRIMRVDEVIIPVLAQDMPWAKMTVLNPRKGMRRKTAMHTGNFDFGAFLQPHEEAQS